MQTKQRVIISVLFILLSLSCFAQNNTMEDFISILQEQELENISHFIDGEVLFETMINPDLACGDESDLSGCLNLFQEGRLNTDAVIDFFDRMISKGFLGINGVIEYYSDQETGIYSIYLRPPSGPCYECCLSWILDFTKAGSRFYLSGVILATGDVW